MVLYSNLQECLGIYLSTITDRTQAWGSSGVYKKRVWKTSCQLPEFESNSFKSSQLFSILDICQIHLWKLGNIDSRTYPIESKLRGVEPKQIPFKQINKVEKYCLSYFIKGMPQSFRTLANSTICKMGYWFFHH